MMEAGVAGVGLDVGTLTNVFPPTPSMIRNATTFGIHASISYLHHVSRSIDYANNRTVPM